MMATTRCKEKITLHPYDIASGFEVRELNPVNYVTWTEPATSRDLAEFVKNLTRGEWWFTHHGKWVSPSSYQPQDCSKSHTTLGQTESTRKFATASIASASVPQHNRTLKPRTERGASVAWSVTPQRGVKRPAVPDA